ncbi:MAG: FG-GAP-like repeat-containing protein [Bacteroidota bacterium]
MDGDYDVIMTTGETRFCYENDGQGNFQQREIFDRNEEEDRTLSIHALCMDVNSDGFKDLLVGKNYLLENDGNAQFQKHEFFWI